MMVKSKCVLRVGQDGSRCKVQLFLLSRDGSRCRYLMVVVEGWVGDRRECVTGNTQPLFFIASNSTGNTRLIYPSTADKWIIISDEADAYYVFCVARPPLARGRSAVSGWIMPTKARPMSPYPGGEQLGSAPVYMPQFHTKREVEEV